MFDIAILFITQLIGIVPYFVALVLTFNIISDLLFNQK